MSAFGQYPSPEDVQNLGRGQYELFYIVGRVAFEDDYGCATLGGVCAAIQPPTPGTPLIVWPGNTLTSHYCDTHNTKEDVRR